MRRSQSVVSVVLLLTVILLMVMMFVWSVQGKMATFDKPILVTSKGATSGYSYVPFNADTISYQLGVGKATEMRFGFNVVRLEQALTTYEHVTICFLLKCGSIQTYCQLFIRFDPSTNNYQVKSESRAYGGTPNSTSWTNISANTWYWCDFIITYATIPPQSGNNLNVLAIIYTDYNRKTQLCATPQTFSSTNPTFTSNWHYISVRGSDTIGSNELSLLISPIGYRENNDGAGYGAGIDMNVHHLTRYSSLVPWPYISTAFNIHEVESLTLLNIIETDSMEKPAFVDSSVAGSGTTQYATTGGNFETYLSAALADIADGLDDLLSLPTADFYLGGILQPVADLLNTLINDLISPSFEFVTDSIVNVFKSIILSIAYIIDEICYAARDVFEDNITGVVNWIHSILNVSILESFDVGDKIGQIVGSLIDDISV